MHKMAKTQKYKIKIKIYDERGAQSDTEFQITTIKFVKFIPKMNVTESAEEVP